MSIIKQVSSLHEPGVRPLNEDTILVDSDIGLFGVFDGASSLVPYLSSDQKTGAYIASHVAAEVFSQSTGGDLLETLSEADVELARVQSEANIDVSDSVNRFSTTVAVVKVKDNHAELLQVADSVIIFIDKDGNTTVPLGYDDRDIAVMRKWRKLADDGKTNIRQILDEDVIQLRRLDNITQGTLNGDGAATKFAKSTGVSLENVASILIISDGMFIPKEDPDGEDDWNYYAQLYKEGGLEKIYSVVRELEKSDPELTKYPRYKLHDDASGVAVDFSE